MDWLHVAVGVIKNPDGEILISRRDDALHQGGLWEFPGGKIEPGETVNQALERELKEELGINVQKTSPLINIKHCYSELAVRLHVYTVAGYTGEAEGREGQPIKWVAPDELTRYKFPTANLPIITAARLPPYYAILDDAEPDLLMVKLNKLLAQGIKLIQARLKRLSPSALTKFLEQAYPLCKLNKAVFLLNSAAANLSSELIDGFHLTSRDLMQIDTRPKYVNWVAASCHNLAELQHAEKIGLDFAVLAPVLPTPTHPDAEVLGWQRFAELTDEVNLPVYALGGMTKAHLPEVNKGGGQGIAAIRAFSQ